MKKLLLIVAVIVLTGAWNIIPASPLPTMSVEDMTREATYVIEGRVENVHSEWNLEHNQIYSFVRVAISRSLKNMYPEHEVTFRFLGGQIPEEDIGMFVPESPHFASGENVVLFMNNNPQAFFPFIGATQGAFHVQLDKSTGDLMAVPQDGAALRKFELESRVQQALSR